jgi:hypothetical protein
MEKNLNLNKHSVLGGAIALPLARPPVPKHRASIRRLMPDVRGEEQ